MFRALTILAAVAALAVSAAPASAFDSQTRPYTDGLAVANHTEGTVSFRPRDGSDKSVIGTIPELME